MSKRIPLSYSAIQNAACPFRFKAINVDKSYKEPESEILRIGSAMADILCNYRRWCYRMKLSSDLGWFEDSGCLHTVDADILPQVKELIGKFSRGPYASVPLHAEWVHVESQPVLNFAQIGGLAFNRALTPLGTDKGAWLHRDVAFRLKADLYYYDPATAELVIIDDKSGWGGGNDDQLMMYAYLIKRSWLQLPINSGGRKLERIRGIFNNVALFTSTEVDFSPSDVDRVQGILEGWMKKVEEWTADPKAEWPAIACNQCDYCTVPGCPLRQVAKASVETIAKAAGYELPAEIFYAEQAQRAMEFKLFIDSMSKSINELLKAWVEKNGSVANAGKIAKFSEIESWEVKDLASFCSALVTWGVPKEMLWQNLSISKAGIEKIIKKNKLESKQAWIEAYLKKSKERRFGIQKDKTI
jgi:hypothetical protein